MHLYSESKDVMNCLLIHHAELQPPHLSHVLFALQYDITPLCETDTLIPPLPRELCWRSCGVATFPMPLWASQSPRDPSGRRGSPAWELEPGQIGGTNEQSARRHSENHHRCRTQQFAGRDLCWASWPSGVLQACEGLAYVGAPYVSVTASDARYDDGVMYQCDGGRSGGVGWEVAPM